MQSVALSQSLFVHLPSFLFRCRDNEDSLSRISLCEVVSISFLFFLYEQNHHPHSVKKRKLDKTSSQKLLNMEVKKIFPKLNESFIAESRVTFKFSEIKNSMTSDKIQIPEIHALW